MIKIGFPRDFEGIKRIFPQKEKEKDLYIVCEETEKSVILGAIRFYYQNNRVDIYEIVMPYQGEDYLEIFDGLMRTLLFKMAEEDCNSLVVHGVEEAYKKYFEDHAFILEDKNYVHHQFPGEFFKACGGCSAH